MTIRGEALGEFDSEKVDVRIINLETAVTTSKSLDSHIGVRSIHLVRKSCR